MLNNKMRNAQAVHIHRPVATGQVRPGRRPNEDAETEAAITAIVLFITGEDLLPPCNPTAMWQGRGSRASK
jgi:hypothetical protein